MSEKYLMANGLRLAYDEFGDSKNPSIVLIMGLGTQMIAWPESMCKGLAENGFHVVRFDNRDIGLSQKIETKKKLFLPKVWLKYKLKLPFSTPYRLHDMADDTIGLLNALNIDKAHWVGASMGGMIAQVLTTSYPERTLSLTSIMSSSGNPDLPQAKLDVMKQLMTSPGQKSEKAYLKHARKTWALIGSPAYPPSEEELTQRLLNSLRRSYYPSGFVNQLAAILESGDRRGLLRRITIPTLIIHGKADRLVPAESSIDIANNVKDSTLKLIEGMGHDLPKELIPRFVRYIVGHINQPNKETQTLSK